MCDFSKLIQAVGTMESDAARASGRGARQVVGVYVGWPGKLYPTEIANLTTFWNRLQAADRLGADHALLREMLQGLAQRVTAPPRDLRPDRRSALVVTGHSMGSRAVFHAVRGAAGSSGVKGGAAPDLVLMVNPAFSAELFREVHVREKQCQPAGVPMLLFSSETDAVTRQVYPAGQAATFDQAAQRRVPFPEHAFTAANFEAFVTHRLHMDWLSGEPPLPHGEQTILRGFQRVPAGSSELLRDNPVTVYRQPKSGRPAAKDAWYRLRIDAAASVPNTCAAVTSKVVAVDTRILPDHGTIFTPAFMEYLVRTFNQSVLAGP